MRILDYFKLASSGIKLHKKRTLQIIFATGTVLCVVASLIFILQGIEITVLNEMTASTNHKILIKTSIENKICEEPCNILVEKQKMKKKINSYHGKIINARIFNLNQYKFYALENIKLLDSVQKKTKLR